MDPTAPLRGSYRFYAALRTFTAKTLSQHCREGKNVNPEGEVYMTARSHTEAEELYASSQKVASNTRQTLFTMTSLRTPENDDEPTDGISTLEDTLQQSDSDVEDALLRRMEACATSSEGILTQPLVLDPGQYGSPEYSPLRPDEKLLGQRGSNEPSPRVKYVIHNWRWEVLGVLVCFVASNAAFVILKVYDKHPLSAWRLQIQLNSLVSVFATITKASLLPAVAQSISQLKWLQFRQSRESLASFQVYDDASRGPLGSVKLLLSLRCRRLAALGAILMIVSLAIDPFAQQVVAYPVRQIVSGSSSVQRTTTYKSETSGMEYILGLETPMRGAVYNGIFAVDAVTQLAPSCPTGNCTWQPFSTLGFCSACSNVTSSTTRLCRVSVTGAARTCNYTLPSGIIINSAAIAGGSDFFVTAAMLNTTGVNAAGIHSPTFAFGLLNNSQTTPSFSECALFFCVQTINVTVSTGIPQSEIMSRWWPDEGTSISALKTDSNMMLKPPQDVDYAKEDLTFVVQNMQATSLQDFLNKDASGTQDPGGALLIGTIRGYRAELTSTADTLMAMFASRNISTLFSNIATSMTNVLRSYGDGMGDDTVIGTAYSMEVFIHVRWQWMALHVAMLVISSVFLITVIQISYRERAPVWKSSSLALLFHGIDEGERLGPLDEIREMEVTAKDMEVAIENREAGYRLVWTLTGPQ